jgi:hypothetical protein
MKTPIIGLAFCLCLSSTFAQITTFGGVIISAGGTNATNMTISKITKDNSGNLYYVGYFKLSGSNTPNYTYFAKYDASNTLLWANEIGNGTSSFSNNLQGLSIAVDANENVYITGSFSGTQDFDPSSNTNNLSASGIADIFIAKYNSLGALVFVNKLGSNSNVIGAGIPAIEVGKDIKIDALGNVYIIGEFFSTTDFDPSIVSIKNLVSNGNSDIFFAKYDTDGNYIFAKNIGGASADVASSLSLDANNNLYLTGYFQGINIDFDPNINVNNITSSGGYDVFFAKYDASGNYLLAKSIGGTNNDSGISIASDLNENIYLTGIFKGTADFDPSNVVFNLISGGENDIFFAKYDATGNIVFAKSIGNTTVNNTINEQSYAIALDANNNIYLIGTFSGVNTDFDPNTTIQLLTSNRFYDIFFAKYDNLGNYIFAYNLGSVENLCSCHDIGRAILVDSNNKIYVAGTFETFQNYIDFDVTSGIYIVGGTANAASFISIYGQSVNLPCSNSLILINPTDNYMSVSLTKEVNSISGTISATNIISGSANITYKAGKSILLDVGFRADTGTVFKTEFGGCNN